MPFWNCFYHLVWSTKHRQPSITLDIEEIIYRAIRERSRELKCHVLVMKAMPDHIHIAANIPPALAISECIQHLKGVSAYRVNQIYPDLETTFRWQGGYGVLTFGANTLPYVRNYINNQEYHHQNNTMEDYLERIT